MSALDAVAALEARIAKLEAAGQSEALTPSYLTVTPAGLVGALFTGLIQALGIVLPSGTPGPPQPDSQVAWKQATDAAIIASIEGASTNTLGVQNAALELNADTHTNPGGATVQIEAENLPLTTFAVLLVQASGPPEVECKVVVQVKGTSGIPFTATVLDDLGQSNFLQLLSTQQLQLAFGGPTPFVYPGGTNQSNPLTVTHNIGRDPGAGAGVVLGLPNGAYGAGQAPSVSCSATAINTATFLQTLPVGVNPAAGNFGNLFWAAAG